MGDRAVAARGGDDRRRRSTCTLGLAILHHEDLAVALVCDQHVARLSGWNTLTARYARSSGGDAVGQTGYQRRVRRYALSRRPARFCRLRRSSRRARRSGQPIGGGKSTLFACSSSSMTCGGKILIQSGYFGDAGWRDTPWLSFRGIFKYNIIMAFRYGRPTHLMRWSTKQPRRRGAIHCLVARGLDTVVGDRGDQASGDRVSACIAALFLKGRHCSCWTRPRRRSMADRRGNPRRIELAHADGQ